MTYTKFVIIALVFVLVAAVVGVSVSSLAASSAHSITPAGFGRQLGATSLHGQASALPDAARTRSQRIPQRAQVVPDWQQVNSNGFGDAQAGEVSALEPFYGHLYAGTHNPTNDARIFRSPNGVTWTPVTDPGFGSDHDTAPRAILDLAVFKGYLYAGTGRGNAAQIWRTQDGENWGRVVNAGFGNENIVDFSALAVYDLGYDQALYVGATEQDSGVQIWRTLVGDGNLNNWTQEATPAMPVIATASVSGMAVFDDGFGPGLYAAVSYGADTPALVWRSFGGAWETAVSDGFGDSNTTSIGGMAVFAGDLYVGAGNTDSGAQLYRTSDGTTWVPATPAFGDANNEKVEQVFVFQNHLYVGVTNTGTGIEIWRSADGLLWEQANLDGFGDSNNSATNGSNATAAFLGQLYVGTSNVVAGGELWRMQEPYSLGLSPDQAQQGPAGQNVTYTLSITNTGTMIDSFDLAAAGHTWTTTLSTSSLSLLAPSASAVFSATVAIPPGAAEQDTDTVIVTATSQGDNSKTGSAVLTSSTVPVLVCGVSAGTPYTLGDISLTITILGNDLDCVRVTKFGYNHPNTIGTGIQTGQYWKIDGLQSDKVSPAAPEEFNLTLPHAITPIDATVCKYPGGLGGAGWDCDRTGSDVSTVWRDGINGGFSDWAVGVAGPTALSLNSFAVSSAVGQTTMAIIVFGTFAVLTFAWMFRRKWQ